MALAGRRYRSSASGARSVSRNPPGKYRVPFVRGCVPAIRPRPLKGSDDGSDTTCFDDGTAKRCGHQVALFHLAWRPTPGALHRIGHREPTFVGCLDLFRRRALTSLPNHFKKQLPVAVSDSASQAVTTFKTASYPDGHHPRSISIRKFERSRKRWMPTAPTSHAGRFVVDSPAPP